MTQGQQDSPVARPFTTFARHYLAAGWEVIPCEPRDKPPAKGLSDATGRDHTPLPETAVDSWAGRRLPYNLGLVLPRGIVGIDVDGGSKPGLATWANLRATYGLPEAPRLTARTDGTGVRLFRLPEGMDEPSVSDLGPGIDVIRHSHRHVMAPGSIHPEGMVYAYLDADGVETSLPEVADLDDLPRLPEAMRGRLGVRLVRDAAAGAKFTDLPGGETCAGMRRIVEHALSEPIEKGGWHDTMTSATMRVLNSAAAGHGGAQKVLVDYRNRWVPQVAADRAARPDAVGTEVSHSEVALGEFRDAVNAGLAKVSLSLVDECYGAKCDGDDPFRGILLPERERPAVSANLTPVTDSVAAEEDSEPWEFIDPSTYERGEPVRPVILRRTDGHALIYPGKVHSIIGPSESGKSWVALAAVLDAVRLGGFAIYLDYEDSIDTYLDRMEVLGATRAELARTRYVAAHVGWRAAVEHAAREFPATTLVVLDGVSEAMGTFGLDPIGTSDAVTFIRWVRRWTDTGAALVMLDHVPKSKEGGANLSSLGSQHKVAGITVTLICSPLGLLAAGSEAKVRIDVRKDRPSGIREHAGPLTDANGARLQHAGTLTFGTLAGGWAVEPPPRGGEPRPASNEDEVRARVAILAFLTTKGEASARQIEARLPDEAKVTRAVVRRALDNLVLDGQVTVADGARRAHIYRLAEAPE